MKCFLSLILHSRCNKLYGAQSGRQISFRLLVCVNFHTSGFCMSEIEVKLFMDYRVFSQSKMVIKNACDFLTTGWWLNFYKSFTHHFTYRSFYRFHGRNRFSSNVLEDYTISPLLIVNFFINYLEWRYLVIPLRLERIYFKCITRSYNFFDIHSLARQILLCFTSLFIGPKLGAYLFIAVSIHCLTRLKQFYKHMLEPHSN